MKRPIIRAIAGIALLASLSASAQTVIFEDTFDQVTTNLTYNDNINSNLIARQVGGDESSSWSTHIDTTEFPAEALQFGPELVGQGFSSPMAMVIQTNRSELIATTGHFSGLAGNKYTISFRGRMSSNVDGSSTGQSGFAIGDNPSLAFPPFGVTSSGLGVHIFWDGRIQIYDGTNKLSVGSGDITSAGVELVETYDLVVTIDEINDALDFIITNVVSGISFTGTQIDISGVDLGGVRKLAFEHASDNVLPENWVAAVTKKSNIWLIDDLNITQTEVASPAGPELMFRDNFDQVTANLTYIDNLNSNLVARLIGGSEDGWTAHIDTTENPDEVLQFGPVYGGQSFNAPMSMVLYTNRSELITSMGHISGLAGNKYTISFRGRVDSNVDISSTGQSGFAIGSGNPSLYGPPFGTTPSGLGVHIYWDGRIQIWDGTNKLTVGNGATAPVALLDTTYDFEATIDEINGTFDFIITNVVSGASFIGTQVDISGVDLGLERKLALEHDTDNVLPGNWVGENTKLIAWKVDDLNITRTEKGPPGTEIIFLDTFEMPTTNMVWDFVNTNLNARQAVGSTGSTYTPFISDGNSFLLGPENVGLGFDQPILMRRYANGGQTILDLNTDFGPDLAGENWTLSYDGNLAVGNPVGVVGWTAVTVGGTNGANAVFNGLSILMHPNGVIDVFDSTNLVGKIVTGSPRANEYYTLTADYNETSETLGLSYESAGYSTNQIFSTPGAWDVGDSRYIEMRHQTFTNSAPPVVEWRFDNLMVSVDYAPPTIGNLTIELLPSGSDVGISWGSDASLSYTVEENDDLVTGSWATNATGIAGTGGSITHTAAVGSVQFFRVQGE